MSVVLSLVSRIRVHGEKPCLARAKFVAEHKCSPKFSENIVGASKGVDGYNNLKNVSFSQCIFIMWMKRKRER